ncbi:related to nucleoside-diphosphate-sugar epimerase [Phialocephala subalpina]|uniref:Related to nucleoside-diphosphate-sugar epimerase n=1 Tax=Phialocephala subalpina TaxID=576137 RepID=A0A1L7WQH4_9HELO|nr:related to nucleoside-diphosphate-sugar epimerase [Phialocephala subalpina]
MSPLLFMTGATGYIGGQFLENIVSKHPDYNVTCLVRTSSQAEQLTAKHPSLHFVTGDLDSTSVLTEQSKLADVVIQTADCDHAGSIKAIFQGLSDPTRSKQGTFIQISGAASALDVSNGYGQASTKVWDDIKDIHEITHFPQTIFHAVTDQLVLSEGKKLGVKTAILEPSIVYGKSDGIKKFSMGLPWMVDAFQKRGKAFIIGEGKTLFTAIHVKDLADVLVLMTEAAVAEGGKMDWREEGVYYVEGGEYKFRDIVERIVMEMRKRGTIPGLEIEEITAEQATEIHPWGPIMWGSKMRTRASRLRGFGWEAKQASVVDAVPELFD